MIQIKINITEMNTGRIALELLADKHKTKSTTKGETQVACQLKAILTLIVTDLAAMTSGSSIAVGEENVETLKGLENLGIKKEEEDDE